jgi:hypothetical protein
MDPSELEVQLPYFIVTPMPQGQALEEISCTWVACGRNLFRGLHTALGWKQQRSRLPISKISFLVSVIVYVL